MIETRVRVISASGGTAWVEPTEAGGCGACQAKSACAISSTHSGLGRFFSRRRQPIPVCAADARPGQELTVAMSEADFLRAGLLAYLLPVVLALAGAGLAATRGAGDAGSALGMALGFAVGLGLAACLGHRIARPSPLAAAPPIPSPNQGETP